MSKLDDAYDQMEAAIRNLVAASRTGNEDFEAMPDSVVAGWVLALDNRGFEDGESIGYVSAVTPNDGQPVYVTKMILREASDIYENARAIYRYSDASEDDE